MGLGALFFPEKYSASNVNWLDRLVIPDYSFETSQANSALHADLAARHLAEGKLTRETYNTQMLNIQSGNLPYLLTKTDPATGLPTNSPYFALESSLGESFDSIQARANSVLDGVTGGVRNIAVETAKASLWVIVALVGVFLLVVWIATRKGVSVT